MNSSCTTTINKKLFPARTRSGIEFSSQQIRLLKQMAQESRKWVSGTHLEHKTPKGSLALFSGAPGTGKTMAAEIMALELGRKMYRVNLNYVVGRSIGETEKNLKRVMKTAIANNAVILVDEADALFGNGRTGTIHHDRGMSSLFELLHSYPGLVIIISDQSIDLDHHLWCYVKYHLKFSPSISSFGRVR